ncbi:hypothetical protein [Ensifer sp. ENS08]|uniref:hypothetical protein n=1 Tax=Ensifer sp. ENS08 TaxID=2769273 RepID=UPI001786D1B3|nr:hypothetical protein [Ensifer sp. ENS08]MBD9571903.1 hypothetical protein [Ensifer sp. ENS08]
MSKVVKFLAATSIAASSFAGAVYADSYYEGIDQNFSRGEIRNQARTDNFATGSIIESSAAKSWPKIKGGEGEFYSGIERK